MRAGWRNQSRPLEAVQPFEWNEGEALVVCDAVCSTDVLTHLAEDLRGGLHPGDALAVFPRQTGRIAEYGAGARAGLSLALGAGHAGWLDVASALCASAALA
jgi:hypothetical protein